MLRKKFTIICKEVFVDNSDPKFPDWTYNHYLKIVDRNVDEVREQKEATVFKSDDAARQWLFDNQKKVRGGFSNWKPYQIY